MSMNFSLLGLAVILQGLILFFLQLKVYRLQRNFRYLEGHFDRLLDMIMAIFRTQSNETKNRPTDR